MRWLLLVIGSVIFIPLGAQHSYQAGLLPALNLNKSLSGPWKINMKIESRQLLTEGVFGESSVEAFNYQLTDVAAVISKKIRLTNSAAGGLLLRRRGTQMAYRLIQQYTITSRRPGLRLAHRMAADQTFQNSTSAVWRLRYRLSTEFALMGESVDPREWYLKINLETLHSLQSSTYDLEFRGVPVLGFVFSDNNKIEAGLDVRLDRLALSGSRSRFWFSMAWYRAL